jgi:hypothetical protein
MFEFVDRMLVQNTNKEHWEILDLQILKSPQDLKFSITSWAHEFAGIFSVKAISEFPDRQSKIEKAAPIRQLPVCVQNRPLENQISTATMFVL